MIRDIQLRFVEREDRVGDVARFVRVLQWRKEEVIGNWSAWSEWEDVPLRKEE